MFFMILVALVALGLGMFQLFHLQRELAELRESTSQRHVASSLEKQIGESFCACTWSLQRWSSVLNPWRTALNPICSQALRILANSESLAISVP